MENNYLNALKSYSKKQKVHIAVPRGKEAWKAQNGKCIKCKKDLKPYLSKYIHDPLTKKVIILCSDCAIKSPKKR